MPLNIPTKTELYERLNKGIESRLFGKVALLRVAVLRILSLVHSLIFHGNYTYARKLLDQYFIATANREFLIKRHGVMWGIPIRSASYATGTAYFTSSNPTENIPEGTKIQSDQGVEYVTTEDGQTALGSAVIPIQAVEPGDSGNLVVDDPVEFQLISPLDNTVNDIVTIQDSITGGIDEEETEDYRQRLLRHVQQRPMGGTAEDYEQWALTIEGVDQAWSYPLASGPGTVTIAITAEGDDPVASPTLISDVSAYIDEVKPVTSKTTVRTVTTVDVKYEIALSPNLSELQDTIKTNIEDIFYPIEPGSTILISQILGAIAASGVTDYAINTFEVDTVSKPIADYDLGGYEYPLLDSIVFVEKS